MTSQHQDYLYNSRRRRLTRIVRFGGEIHDSVSSAESAKPDERVSYPYYGLSSENPEKEKHSVGWLFTSLPLIVLLAMLVYPILGLIAAFLSLGFIIQFFWHKFK